MLRLLRVCAEGCYKHLVNGKWICCKCNTYRTSNG